MSIEPVLDPWDEYAYAYIMGLNERFTGQTSTFEDPKLQRIYNYGKGIGNPLIMTQLINDAYTRKYLPEYFQVELIPKFWHETNEDLIWCECPSDPSLNTYHFYASLKDWTIYVGIP